LEKVWNVKQKKVNFNYSNIGEFIKLNNKLIKNYKAGCNNKEVKLRQRQRRKGSDWSEFDTGMAKNYRMKSV